MDFKSPSIHQHLPIYPPTYLSTPFSSHLPVVRFPYRYQRSLVLFSAPSTFADKHSSGSEDPLRLFWWDAEGGSGREGVACLGLDVDGVAAVPVFAVEGCAHF